MLKNIFFIEKIVNTINILEQGQTENFDYNMDYKVPGPNMDT